VAEVLLEYSDEILGEDGKSYTARACGAETTGGLWQGWIEFLPRDGGEPIRSARETTQPNRADTLYWATGLTPVYLEGALRRAIDPLVRPIAADVEPPRFDAPAPNFVANGAAIESVLDPFSVYRKGEPLLRRQLSALADWHLVNIIRRYELSDETPASLVAMKHSELVEIIINGVRRPRTQPR